jgi:hypothetical protein
VTSWKKDDLPPAIKTALEGLGRTTALYPYAGWAEGEQLDSRLGRAANWLKANELDGEALYVLVGALRYLTTADWDKLWRDVAQRLKAQLSMIGASVVSARFVQAPGEGHVESLFTHGEWQYRHSCLCPVDADRLLQMALSEEAASWTDLREMDSTPVWVHVWDQSLSGKTMATQLKRLHMCQAILPTASERRLIGACPVVTKEALDRVRESCPAADIVYALQIDTAENLRCVLDEWRNRVRDLCEAFYERYIAPYQTELDRDLRGVEAFGYKNSYALVLPPWQLPKQRATSAVVLQ